MSTNIKQNEIKRTGPQSESITSKEVAIKQAVNDFINEGNPTVSPPEVDEKKVEKIIAQLSNSQD